MVRQMEVIRFSETLFHILTTRRHIPEDGNIHNYRCENFKSCLAQIVIEHNMLHGIGQYTRGSQKVPGILGYRRFSAL
jgi:hypothetical protein